MPTALPSTRTMLYLRLPNWLGDVCMCLPIIEALLAKKQYELVICARPWAQQLLAHYPIKQWVKLSGKMTQDAKLVKQHRQRYAQQPARGLIIPDSFSSAAVFWWASIPSAGVKDEGRSFFLRWPFDKPSQSLHTVQYWYELAYLCMQRWHTPIEPLTGHQLRLRLPNEPSPAVCAALGFKHDSPQHNAAHHTDTDHAALPAAAGNTTAAKPIVLIAPTATGKHKGQIKVWPHFEALTLALQKQGIRVIMCPPPNEIDQACANAPSAERIPPLPIDQFALLCRSVAIVICNDSGVSHVAAAAQATQITLFGVTSAKRTGPWSEHAHCLGSVGQWPSLQAVIEQCSILLQAAR